jgi:hypothetical protein
MPGYPGNNLATLLYENRQAFLFQNERVSAGERSVAFQLRRTRGNFYPWGASFAVRFSGAPGTFAIDIQVADADEDASYVSVTTLNSVSGGNAARYDMMNIFPRFVRASVGSLGNAVNATLMVTR